MENNLCVVPGFKGFNGFLADGKGIMSDDCDGLRLGRRCRCGGRCGYSTGSEKDGKKQKRKGDAFHFLDSYFFTVDSHF